MNLKKILNGNWIYNDKPASRFFFHCIISGSVIVTSGAFIITNTKAMFLIILIRCIVFIWIYWLIRAFLGWTLNWANETNESEKKTSWQISTGTCPNCLKKISRLATKCPYCTAKL